MTAVLVTDAPANSDAWHAARRQGIGASEIAAVVGLSPFESPFSLWHRKKGNLSGPDPSNPLFYWGHALEPLVAAKFAEDHPDYRAKMMGTYRHSRRPWQFANLDRALTRRDSKQIMPLEIKTTRYPDGWGRSESMAPDAIPLHVRCQVLQQMDVFSAPYAWVAVLIGGNDYREYRIEYDAEDAAALREAGSAFWDSLQTDDEPPIDASFETYEAVRELHPEIDPDLDCVLDQQMWNEFATTKAQADRWEREHQKVKSQILAAMGDARRALVNNTPVLRRQKARGGSVALYPVKESA
ncbi:YqaJ viral recombinase family protein [Nocardioides sp. cx-169]|uniref:YqaJ viral recombinase family nuclease n=1 Tax=Nocardioides sp. cx-169 TaxID=2899080 RepID=UPI001E3372D3|nr:YqaJ viral recombinase family protein [Nocardioides sp. cx-169]MCD4535675.1 YqaJ viral recombinase family protein [Nocardioides sp. cx-169]